MIKNALYIKDEITIATDSVADNLSAIASGC